MGRLLDRVLGRSSPNEREPDALGPPVLADREPPASIGSVASPAESRVRVIEALRNHVAEGSGGRLRAQDIREGAELLNTGYLDSFSYVEFLAFIEQTYGVRIDDSQLAGHLNTIAAMAEHILQEQTRLPE
jgi:acyl carrier protein